ncbi:MAG: hypothetical protein H5U33_27420 [Pseudomonas sp.]|nr:hypothetical protein [Pseudomonas sp.]
MTGLADDLLDRGLRFARSGAFVLDRGLGLRIDVFDRLHQCLRFRLRLGNGHRRGFNQCGTR